MEQWNAYLIPCTPQNKRQLFSNLIKHCNALSQCRWALFKATAYQPAKGLIFRGEEQTALFQKEATIALLECKRQPLRGILGGFEMTGSCL